MTLEKSLVHGCVYDCVCLFTVDNSVVWGVTPRFGGAQTPMVGSMTPMHGMSSGRTPMYGSQTPQHGDGQSISMYIIMLNYVFKKIM